MTTEGSEDKDGMDRQDDEALWNLMGRHTPSAQASPYFARRVLREIALAEPSRTAGWRGRLGNLWAGAAIFRRSALWSGMFSGVCALGLFCLSMVVQRPARDVAPREETAVSQASPAGTPLVAVQTVDATAAGEAVPVQEVEVIADLDNILEREESRLWTDDTARF